MGSLLKICWRDRTNAGLLSGTQHGKIIQAKKGEALLYMEGKVSAIVIEILDKEKEMLKV